MKRRWTLLSGIVVAAALLSGCGGGTGKVTEVRVVMVDDLANGFQPKQITAAPGTLKVTLENKGAIVHDFVITQLGVKETVDPGKSKTVQFKADKAGTYPVDCTQPGHKDLGMKGTLVVK